MGRKKFPPSALPRFLPPPAAAAIVGKEVVTVVAVVD